MGRPVVAPDPAPGETHHLIVDSDGRIGYPAVAQRGPSRGGYPMNLLLRWLITAVAVAAAVWLVPGITVQGNGVIVVLVMAVVLGLVNAIVRPVLTFLSCPLVLLTFGLFLIVINAFTFWFASWIAQNWLNQGFVVDGFLPALLGSIVVSIVGAVLTLFLPDRKD
jgi:putative membrane protein